MQIINIMPPKKLDVANKKLKELEKKVKPVLTQEQLDAENRRRKAKAKENAARRAILTKPGRDRAREKFKLPNVTTGYQEKAVIANEEAIRESFNKIVELSDENLIKEEMENLVLKRNWGSIDESQKMLIIIQVLHPSMYKDLANAYINQDKAFFLFWPNYISRPKIIRDMEKNKEEIDSLSFQKPKPRKLTYREPQRVNKVDTRPPWEKGVKELDYDGDVIEPPKTEVKSKLFFISKPLLSIPPFEDCFKEKKTSIIENVTKTFITPIGNDSENERFKSIINSRGVTESFTESKSKQTWYLVNENLAKFLCKTNRIWNDKSSSVIAILRNNKRIHFKVGYMTNEDTFFVQEEEHFRKESVYVNKLKKTRDGQIGGILGSRISPAIQNFARSFLSESLSRVATDVTKYQNTEEHGYVYESVQKMIELSEGSTKKLFENLANITVFLKNQNSVFAERIRDQYYIPPILVTLSIEEKLPEVFDDPNQNKKFVKNLISREINLEVKRIAESLYNRKNPTESKPTLAEAIIPRYKVRPSNDLCDNKLDDDVKISDVFYYTEGGKVYCLLIKDVYTQIKNKQTPVNNITRKPFDTDFLERFRELYDYKFNVQEVADKISEKQTPTPTPSFSRVPPVRQPKSKDIAPWLLKTIIENIKECEKECEGELCENKCKSFSDDYDKFYETDEDEGEEDFNKYSSKMLSSDSDSEPKTKLTSKSKKPDKDLIGSSLKDEDSDKDSDKERSLFSSDSEPKSKSKNPDKKLFSSEESDESDEFSNASSEVLTDDESDVASNVSTSFEEPEENSPILSTPFHVKEGNICQYCEKKINKNKKLYEKTKIKNNQGQHQNVLFCDLGCFEHYKFPDYKNERRKGGRNDSRDRKKK